MRAKPGVFRGEFFRSQLEIRCAQWLSWLDLNWSYEHRAFPYTDAGGYTRWYLPDFWVPDFELGVFLEVRPDIQNQVHPPAGFLPLIAQLEGSGIQAFIWTEIDGEATVVDITRPEGSRKVTKDFLC